MRPRSYSWPQGHWDWYRHLAFKHGIRCGPMIFVGGQVDKTSDGEPCHVGDLKAQTEVVIAHIARVLEEFGASLADVTRLVALYATDGDVDEREFVADVGRHVTALGGAPDGVGPVIVPTPLPWLALPGMRVEIEAVAMLGEGGARLAREGVVMPDLPSLPPPFQHGLRCQEHVFVGAINGAGDEEGVAATFAALNGVLARLGARPSDLVRIGVWGSSDDLPSVGRYLDELGAASVVLPTSRLPARIQLRLDGWAMCHRDDRSMTRSVTIQPDDWCWPDRRVHTKAVACGDYVFVSGQMPLDGHARAMHPGDLGAQTALCIERTRQALAAFGLELDNMVKQTSYFLGNADPKDIVTNQTLRSSSYREPAGASTGVPLNDFGVTGAMASIDTIAMR